MISVIMPLYNEEIEDLIFSIDSVLNQTENRLELILILDNPENEKIKKLMENYKNIDSRIVTLYNKKNMGVGLTLNKAIKHAKYDFIARLDADDISKLNRLELQLSLFFSYPDIDMVSTNCIYIDDMGNKIGEKPDIPTDYEDIKAIMPYGSTIIHSSVMYKKKSFEKIGGYRQLLSCQDYDLWLRMLDGGMKIVSLNDRLVYYRIRSNSITGSQSLRLLLTEKYVRGLQRERTKFGRDSFSFENYMDYLDRYGYNDEYKKDKFSEATDLFNSGITLISKKNFLLGLKNIINAVFIDKRIYIKLKNLFIYKLKRKKLRV